MVPFWPSCLCYPHKPHTIPEHKWKSDPLSKAGLHSFADKPVSQTEDEQSSLSWKLPWKVTLKVANRRSQQLLPWGASSWNCSDTSSGSKPDIWMSASIAAQHNLARSQLWSRLLQILLLSPLRHCLKSSVFASKNSGNTASLS